MSTPDRQLQLIDGPEEHQGIHDEDALRDLVQRGAVPFEARTIDLGTMATGGAGELLGLSADEAGDAPPLPAGPGGTAAAAPALGGDLVLGERISGDTASAIHSGQRRSDGAAVSVLVIADTVPAPQRTRFAQTSKALVGLESPNVVRVHEVISEGETLSVVMDPLEGRSLASLMIGSPPGLDLVEQWVAQAANGLWAASKQGALHLDLGPESILLRPDGSVALWGFGLGPLRKVAAAETWARSLPYRAPEQLAGDAGNHASDIYALAAMIYQLLGTRAPFPGSDAGSLRQAIEAGAPSSLSERDARIPGAIDIALATSLSADPGNRPNSANAFAREIRDAIHGTMRQRRRSGTGLSGEQAAQSGANAARGSSADLASPRASGPHRGSSTTLVPPARTSGGPKGLIALVVIALLGGGGFFGWKILTAPDGATRGVDPNQPTQPNEVSTAATPEPAPGDQPSANPEPSEPTDTVPTSDIELLAAWQQAEDRQDWANSHRWARSFAARFPQRVREVRLRMPLVITPNVPSAEVLIDGVAQGTGTATYRYTPGSDALVVVHAPGYRPVVAQLRELRDNWSWQPQLAELKALRWLQVLPGVPSTGASGITKSRALVPGKRDAVVVSLATGNVLNLRLDGGGTALNAPVVYRDLALLLHAQRMTALDANRGMLRWHAPAGTKTPFTHGMCAGGHELIPEQSKAWALSGSNLRCFVLRSGGAQELSPTRLPAPASAPPAMVMVDSAMSAVAVPCGRQLAVFDGATTSHGSSADLSFTLDLTGPVTVAPLAMRHNERPWLIIADDTQRLLALDPRPGVENRSVAEWYMPDRPAATPVRIADSRLMVGLESGQVVAVDLDKPGLVLWTADGGSALTGAPAVTGDRFITAHRNGDVQVWNARNGENLARYQLELTPIGAPVVDGDKVLIVTAEGLAIGLNLE
ncbi:MAG: serine/threonine-protein kinase [Planctomycetota bacterium]|jgi:serine/threonine protein kinase|nr:serine/threonine-protein kinase [Planctomycetota bacterium]